MCSGLCHAVGLWLALDSYVRDDGEPSAWSSISWGSLRRGDFETPKYWAGSSSNGRCVATVLGQNHNPESGFTLVGFSTFPRQLLPAFFLLFLLMYLVMLLGNLLIVVTIWSERSLHTAMYLFLCALSTSEVLYTFIIIPRMLADLFSRHSIAFLACASQMFFSFTFGFTHSFLLTVMGYDRYVTICHLLHYHVLMSPRGCACLVAWSWAGGSVMGLVVTTSVFHLSFCGSHEVHHFFCHMTPLLKLACGDGVPVVAMSMGLLCIMTLLGCFVFILLSYAFIVTTIFRQKAFSTCASHLTVVVVHYDFASVIYLKPKGPQSLEGETLMATTYTVLTPFLSPIIFSLRNQELKIAMKKTFLSKPFPAHS
ncbi:olfactory receptor 10H2-like [Tamandua tetradactyla]|uniref:olfactory receptor 10H2-like n=1 Tax=Tamandua tetradactyla TaxID=48850 RepID=UPI004053AA11